VAVTIFGTDPGAGHTTDTVHGIGNGHYHRSIVIEIIIVVVIVHLSLDQIEYGTGADLETAPTTDAVGLIQIDNELWRPALTATGQPGNYLTHYFIPHWITKFSPQRRGGHKERQSDEVNSL
jgi:hypothetical protein